MSRSKPDDDALFHEAMDLVIRLQNDPENAISQDLIRRWRLRSSAHENMWQEAVGLHSLAGKAITNRRRRHAGIVGKVSRRTVIAGAGGALAAAAIGAAYIPSLILRSKADFLTATAEVKRVPLPDGSVATLGPDSAIRLDFSPERRGVELLAGMAFFEVAKDHARPFQAATVGLTATALGTAFDIRDDAGVLSVSVDHGLVEARMPASPLMGGMRLAEGEWIRLDPASLRLEQGKREASQVAAWRQGMLVADRETIGSVVAQIGRWQPGRIVFADQSLASRRISGLFDLNKPILALEAVVEPYGGKVRQISPWLTVISPI